MRYLVSLLTLIFLLSGCGGKDNPVFDMKENSNSTLTTYNYSFALQESALPTESNPSSTLTSADLPSPCIFLTIPDEDRSNDGFFRVDVVSKGLQDIYDLPLTIQYDPSFIKTGDSTDSAGPLMGRVYQNKINFLPTTKHLSIVGKNQSSLTNGKQNYLISINLQSRLGAPYNKYDGVLVSLFFWTVTPNNLDTVIGFVTDESQVLDVNGNGVTVGFYGGTITK